MQIYKKMTRNGAFTEKHDEKYMRRCIQLARNGQAGAAPNPMVGAVIVCDGKIIGEGYHRRCGGPHAEVNAIRSVRRPELLERSTIYVSLEPCAHYGKTPPCADLIIEKRIPRCVVGCRDSFEKVDGLGIKKLRDAGVEVVVGVLEKECQELNRRFFTYHTSKRPFVTLKWAQSSDGIIGQNAEQKKSQQCADNDGTNGSAGRRVVFSTALTTTLVHRMRALSDAILVGGRTALADNPSLTVRSWHGKNPLRVVIDTHDSLPSTLALFNEEAETLVWKDNDLHALMDELYGRKVQTLMVEGGAEVLHRFIEAGLWDEIRVETAPVVLGAGVKAPSLPEARLVSTDTIDGNEIRCFRRKM